MFKKLFKKLAQRFIPSKAAKRINQAKQFKKKAEKTLSLQDFIERTNNRIEQIKETNAQLKELMKDKALQSRKLNKAKKEFRELQLKIQELVELESGVMKFERAAKKSYTGLDQFLDIDVGKINLKKLESINKTIRNRIKEYGLDNKRPEYLNVLFHVLSRLEENPYDPNTEYYKYHAWNKKYVQTELSEVLRHNGISKKELHDIIAMYNDRVLAEDKTSKMISEEEVGKLMQLLELMELFI